MEYRIEELGFEFKVVGKKHLINTATATEEITKIYSQSHTNGLLEKLINMAWENPQCKLESILGVIGNTSSITEDTFEFIMGVRYDKSVNGMDEIIIPPCTWAVFPNIKDAWQRLYTEWLPSSNYELVDLPCIEHSLPPGNVPENELWVPLKYKE